MKEIKAVIRPAKLANLRSRLHKVPGFPGMTVSKAEGCTALSRYSSRNTVKEELTDYTPKVRIEIVAPDDMVQDIVDVVIQAAQTGQIGDGLVWVTDIVQASFIHKLMPDQSEFGL